MKKIRKRAGPTPFGKILRSLMSERDMTIRQAAAHAGVSASTVDDWRGGALPEDYSAVKRLADALNVSFSFLLTGEEDNQTKKVTASITEVFDDGGALFDGFAKITIQRLIPRKKEK